MNWYELKVTTTHEASEAVSEILTSLGSGGVCVEDKNDIIVSINHKDTLDYVDDDFLDALNDDVIVKAYFQKNINIKEIISSIKERLTKTSQFLDIGKGLVECLDVNEEDWATAWKKYYTTFNLTDNITIKPSWEEYVPKNHEMVIELDPGMAFGTGTHETTKMCAILLEEYLKSGDEVIDIGTGTGILSIIAAKLGASAVTAVDIDDVAVRVAKENLYVNKVYNVEVIKGILLNISKNKRDLIVANIISNVIIELKSVLSDYLKPGGIFIASGIIKDREKEVMDNYIETGFICEKTLRLSEWVAMVFRCQDFL